MNESNHSHRHHLLKAQAKSRKILASRPAWILFRWKTAENYEVHRKFFCFYFSDIQNVNFEKETETVVKNCGYFQDDKNDDDDARLMATFAVWTNEKMVVGCIIWFDVWGKSLPSSLSLSWCYGQTIITILINISVTFFTHFTRTYSRLLLKLTPPSKRTLMLLFQTNGCWEEALKPISCTYLIT